MGRKKIREVVAKEIYDDSNNLGEFVNWLSNQVDLIPQEYLNVAEIEFSEYQDYDSFGIRIEIFYHRPETDDEMAKREKEVADKEADERRLYERLKAKYEGV